jgi:two-component sensor histidine kinase
MQLQTMTAKPRSDHAVVASNIRLEAMLGEMNHRVANSLQLVSAMVSLQARGIADPAAREALRATQRRIEAVAQVHSRLYRSHGAEDVDLAAYLADLAGQLHDSYDRPISVEAAAMRVPVDRAISIGVIVSELVSNACKYAYDAREPGGVSVRLSTDPGGGYRLEVADRGIGLPAEGRVRGTGMPAEGRVRGTGMGRHLIELMAQSLRATGGYEAAPAGTRYVLRGRG